MHFYIDTDTRKSNAGLFIHTVNNFLDLDEGEDGLGDYFLKYFGSETRQVYKSEAATGYIS